MLREELAAIAGEWLAAARVTWPTITLDETTYLAEVTARLPASASPYTARAVHAADLWLALACAAGDPKAIAAFDEHYVARLKTVLATLGLAPDEIDDVKQELRRKLLVADGRRPRIAEFSGRADLRRWVRTVAVRISIDRFRQKRDVLIDDEEQLAMMNDVADDPELVHLKERYRYEVRAAIGRAIKLLTTRQRLLLKAYYIDRLGVKRLGVMLSVHHATAARWLIAAREALAKHAQRLLMDELGMSHWELRNVARL